MLPAYGIQFWLPFLRFSRAEALKPGDTLLRVPSLLHISPSYVRSLEADSG